MMDVFRENKVLALLAYVEALVEAQLRAKRALDGVDMPLSETIYRLGKTLPSPIAQSIRLCVLYASTPVPKTR